MISLHLDAMTGVVRTVVRKSVTRDDMERYLISLDHLLGFVREQWGSVQHLVDVRHITLESDADYLCLSGASIELYGDDDRTAAIVGSETAIVHLGEMPSQFRTMTFSSNARAMQWLRAAATGEVELL